MSSFPPSPLWNDTHVLGANHLKLEWSVLCNWNRVNRYQGTSTYVGLLSHGAILRVHLLAETVHASDRHSALNFAAVSIGAFASGESTGDPFAEGGGASPQAAFRSPSSPRCFGARAGLASDTRFPHRRRGPATGKRWLRIGMSCRTFALVIAFSPGLR